MRIRTRLALALLVPLVALVVSSSLVISAADQRAQEASTAAAAVDEQVALATAALGPSGILGALNAERTGEALALIGLDPSVTGDTRTLVQIRTATNEAAEQLRTAIAAKPRAVQDTYAPALQALRAVTAIRSQSDLSTDRTFSNPDATAAYDRYSVIVQAIFDANTRAATAVDNAELRAGVRFIDALSRYNDAMSVIQRSIGGALTFGGATRLTQAPASLAQAAGLSRIADELRNQMVQSDDPQYHALAAQLFGESSVLAAERSTDGAVAGDAIDLQTLLGPVTRESTVAYGTYKERAAAELQADADRIRTDAQTEADEAARQSKVVLVFTTVVLVGAAAVTVMASRSISRPLSRLVGAAEHMAARALPETVQSILDTPPGEDVEMPELAAIDDRGGYEVAEVASALNTVQRSAADLAVEQAVLRRNISDAFVNLGRRNQALLARLLDTITNMELDEADPEELRKLFTLDHLATRMRRNAESLVVLAGVETRRQWSTPVALIDVVRGGLGEVEDFERVEVLHLDDVRVKGNAAADLTHMVAELLENALTYSPPGRRVEIRGYPRPEGYQLAIIDHGVGMDPDDLMVANNRLSGNESFTVAPSRYLGHYVVGLQASRLGLKVVLHDTPGGGTTATISLGALTTADEVTPTVAAADRRAATASRWAEEAAERDNADEAAPAGAGGDETDPAGATVDAADAGEPVETPEPVVAGASDPVAGPATIAGPAPEPAPPLITAAGYVKRVRGAHVRDHAVRQARPSTPVGASSDSPTADAGTTAAPGGDRVEGAGAGSLETSPAQPATTAAGYAKRVRGAHTPNTSLRSARANPASRGSNGAEAMRSALSSMHAGMQRSRTESETDRNEAEAP
jgi:signal transduction histidine kinase